MKRRSVQDAMTWPVVTVAPTATYHEIVDAMVSRRISALPVVDANGFVLGIVSEADLLHKVEFAGVASTHHLIERRRAREGRMKADAVVAADLMSKPAITIRPDETIGAAAAAMSDHHVKRLPVVDRTNTLVGIVSRSDILRLYVRPDDEVRSEIRTRVLQDTLWIEPDSLDIVVEDGVAVLTGTVDRFSTASILVQLVETVPGVVQVIDHLGFDYDDRRRSPAASVMAPRVA
jgi:CBS domain-containing protein